MLRGKSLLSTFPQPKQIQEEVNTDSVAVTPTRCSCPGISCVGTGENYVKNSTNENFQAAFGGLIYDWTEEKYETFKVSILDRKVYWWNNYWILLLNLISGLKLVRNKIFPFTKQKRIHKKQTAPFGNLMLLMWFFCYTSLDKRSVCGWKLEPTPECQKIQFLYCPYEANCLYSINH